MQGIVTAVSRSPTHSIAKWNQNSITLVAGLGVDGDAHNGKTVKHLSRLLRFGNAPNRRQVHLIHAELHQELRIGGFSLVPGQMGENVTTRGVDLLGLPTGARLHLGSEAVIEVTGDSRRLSRFTDDVAADAVTYVGRVDLEGVREAVVTLEHPAIGRLQNGYGRLLLESVRNGRRK